MGCRYFAPLVDSTHHRLIEGLADEADSELHAGVDVLHSGTSGTSFCSNDKLYSDYLAADVDYIVRVQYALHSSCTFDAH